MSGLVVLAPPAQAARFSLNPQRDCVIGRGGFCDIVLAKRTVSRKHARIFFAGGQYRIEDLSSSHGTFLNGHRVSRAMTLNDGDRINVFDIPLLYCESDEPRIGDTSQFSLNQTLGTAIAPLPSTRTETASLAYNGRLHSLLEITRRLGSSLVMDEIFPRVLDLLFHMFPQAAVGEMDLVDEQGHLKPVAMKYGRDDDSSIVTRLPVGSDLAKQVLTSGQPLLKSVESGSEESVLDVSGSNVLCVPIVGPTQSKLGTILLETDDSQRVFTDDDVELMSSIGIVTGQALEYAHAHAGVMQMVHTQRELEAARQLQLLMLPRQRPNVPGYAFECFYEPAESVGGDYYFWEVLRDGRVMLGVADACGKSLPAALIMAQFSTEIRHCLTEAETLKQAMTSLNRFVCGLDSGFITFCLCLLDTSLNLLTVVNAGHPPPIQHWQETGRVESLSFEKSSLPLGLSPQEQFHPFHVPLRPGDELFLFTDGLIEAMDSDNNLYGIDRFASQIALPQPSLSSRISAIIADVSRFRIGGSISDDVCLLGIAREQT